MLNILPQPVNFSREEGLFVLDFDVNIILDTTCSIKDFNSAKLLQQELKETIGLKANISKSFNLYKEDRLLNKNRSIFFRKKDGKEESYTLKISSDLIMITGADDAGLLYGVQTLRQIIREYGVDLPCLSIEDFPYFKNRGFYHDITRGKVPTLKTLKELVDRISFYKINQLQLYIEHTFAFKNYTEIWTGSDPLTSEEILLLDEYCQKKNVELVPSLATFGHLYHALRTNTFSHLAELEGFDHDSFSWIERMRHHTLDVSNPESMDFIKNILKEFIPLFSSNKFNICGDETFDLGKGKNKELAEKLGKGRLYLDFLNKIINEVKKYGKEVMFWGDIILKYPELLDELSKENISCLNWDYSINPSEKNFESIYKSGINQYVCPGVSGWNRLMNDMDKGFLNITKVVWNGKKYNAVGVLNTDWGDYGHINFFANSIPGMIYGAALSWNPEIIESGMINENRDQTIQDNILFKEYDEIDKVISKLEFADNTGEITGILRRLARQQIVNWGDIVHWKEKNCDKISIRTNIEEKLKALCVKELKNAYTESLKLSHNILKLSTQINVKNKADYKEFYISGQGIALFNILALYIKKIDYKEIIKIDFSAEELAIKLEYWFSKYKKIWRIRNKESELNRIEDTIIVICKYLRENSENGNL